MTVARLHKLLGELLAKGHARTHVVVSKTTFTHPLEPDGCTLLDVQGVSIHVTEMLDDDGGTLWLADGSAAMRTNAVLFGDHACKHGHEDDQPCHECGREWKPRPETTTEQSVSATSDIG